MTKCKIMQHTTYIPTRLLFGKGMLDELSTQTMPGKSAMVILSNGQSTRASGTLDRTLDQLSKAGIEAFLFDHVEPNPLKSTVMLGGAFVRETHCDFIVALGGGSVMDAAKAIAVIATNDGDYWDYVTSGTGKGMPLTHRPLPIVAITTTAGTGSETDAACVITNEETNEKTGFGNPALFPVLAIVDPELTRTVPPVFTAYQGFDALFHSVECYIANKANAMSDMYALTAIENVAKYLARAVHDGNDMTAREHVAFASTLSGVVMTISGCTSEHSLEHALSAYHQGLPHGAGLIMISKAYFSHFIKAHVCDDRFVSMAHAMGRKDAMESYAFIEALDQLQADCGVDALKMSEYGIAPDEFEKMAQNAQSTMGRLFLNDPAPLSQNDCVSIYRESYR